METDKTGRDEKKEQENGKKVRERKDEGTNAEIEKKKYTHTRERNNS